MRVLARMLARACVRVYVPMLDRTFVLICAAPLLHLKIERLFCFYLEHGSERLCCLDYVNLAGGDNPAGPLP